MRMPPDLLIPQLKPMLEGLLLWSEDSKNKFKLKVRMIIERLARRCGHDALAAVMPPSEVKLLAHIRKQHHRKDRRRSNELAAGSQVGLVVEDDALRAGNDVNLVTMNHFIGHLLCTCWMPTCMQVCTTLMLHPGPECLQ